MEMGGAAPTHLISELQCDFAKSDEKIDEYCQYYQFHINLLFSIPPYGYLYRNGFDTTQYTLYYGHIKRQQ